MNLIIKSKLVNWKAITGGYGLTGFLSTIPHLPLLLSIFKLIYAQALLNYTLNSFILKENIIYKIILLKNTNTSQTLVLLIQKILKFGPDPSYCAYLLKTGFA